MFNMVDGHIERVRGEIADHERASREIASLAGRFATAVFRREEEPSIFNDEMRLAKFCSAMYLFHAEETEPVCP